VNQTPPIASVITATPSCSAFRPSFGASRPPDSGAPIAIPSENGTIARPAFSGLLCRPSWVNRLKTSTKPDIARKNVVITPRPATYPRLRNRDGSITGLPDRRTRQPNRANAGTEAIIIRIVHNGQPSSRPRTNG